MLAPARAATPKFQLSAVDSNTFHLVVYPSDQPAPPSSPFVVQTAPWPQAVAKTNATSSSVRVAGGALTLDARGNWQLKAPRNLTLSGAFSESNDQTTFTVKHAANERFYGAGNEKRDFSGSLLHPSGTQFINNGVTRVPFLWSTGGYSVLVANDQSGASWNDSDDTLTWTMPASYLDVYLSVAPDAYGLLNAYSRLTGPAPIPPRWTFGFMMSRWGYDNNADVQDKWHQFRERKIPVDTFIYDYDWFTNDWEFNNEKFPASNLDEMENLGLHMVGIRKPRLSGSHLDFARSQNWMLSSPQGGDLRFDLPAASYWWWSHQAPLVKAGVDGWWNDEAEQTMDEYFWMSRAQYTGWRAQSPRRVWMINRGFSPGIQRFGAATWTGDTHGSWDNLRNQKGIMLNWSLSGMPFTSDDIGGFENLPTPELYTRWMQSSVFGPVMRAHCTYLEVRWPWSFGPQAEAATRKAIELRYRLIPYLYTLAEQTSRTGAPMMRPLLMEFPDDPKTFDLRDQWLMGARLLVAPVLQEGGARDVYLPQGDWYGFNSNARIAGGQTLKVTAALDEIPMYTRAGTILPLGPIMQSTMLGKPDPLEVRVYPGADAQFSLYEDDGDNYDYQKGAFTRTPMNWDDKTQTLSIGPRVGTFPGLMTTRHFQIVLPNRAAKTVIYAGNAVKVKF